MVIAKEKNRRKAVLNCGGEGDRTRTAFYITGSFYNNGLSIANALIPPAHPLSVKQGPHLVE